MDKEFKFSLKKKKKTTAVLSIQPPYHFCGQKFFPNGFHLITLNYDSQCTLLLIQNKTGLKTNILMNYDFVYCTFSGDLNGDLLAAISEGGSGAGPLTGDIVFLGLSGGRGAEPLLGFQTFVTDFSSFLFIFYRLISLRNN